MARRAAASPFALDPGAEHRRRLGERGETIAARHLCRLGLVLLDRNWRCDAGEIDLVLRDGNVLVICEVKTRTSTDYGAPLEAVDRRKADRLQTARRAVAARARLPSRRRPHRPGGRAGPARWAGRGRARRGGRLMAFATARSLALKGADGHVIDVQVDVSPGLVNTTIVGRVDKSLSEARDRVRMAINNDCGRWPATKRVTILLVARRPPQERHPLRPRDRDGGHGGRQEARGADARPAGGVGVHRRAVRGRGAATGAGGAAHGHRRCRPRHHPRLRARAAGRRGRPRARG